MVVFDAATAAFASVVWGRPILRRLRGEGLWRDVRAAELHIFHGGEGHVVDI